MGDLNDRLSLEQSLQAVDEGGALQSCRFAAESQPSIPELPELVAGM